MPGTPRTVEVNNSEVYVDLNDLIIEFMLLANSATSEAERHVYNVVVQRLTTLRNSGHGAKSIRVPGTTL